MISSTFSNCGKRFYTKRKSNRTLKRKDCRIWTAAIQNEIETQKERDCKAEKEIKREGKRNREKERKTVYWSLNILVVASKEQGNLLTSIFRKSIR